MAQHLELIKRLGQLRDDLFSGSAEGDADWHVANEALKALEGAGEPVAWRIWSPDGANVYQYTEDGDGEPLYTRPAPLVPMTKDEAEDIWNLWETGKASGHEIILAVEAHHGAKP